MDIYAKPGSLVIYLDENGHEYQREAARRVLFKGQTYEVEDIGIDNWCSDVKLKGIDGVFNTVMFADKPLAGDGGENVR